MAASSEAASPLAGVAVDGTAGWLGIPRPPRLNVTRPRLLDLLDTSADVPLVLVSAPAGSGKTSLVAEWVATGGDRENTGWITFETGSRSFWPGVLGCLRGLGVELEGRPFPQDSTRLGTDPLGALAAALASSVRRLTLVIDGYEIVSSEVADDLGFLVRHSAGRRGSSW